MSSDLSIFAARLREFIGLCAEEPAFAARDIDPALQSFYDAQFNAMALVLFALQFTHNAPYRKLCEASGILPDNVHHWTQIPTVPAAAFKEWELTCLPAQARTRVFHSSGTTAQRPSQHFHSTESLEVYETSLWPWFCAHLISGLQDEGGKAENLVMFLVPPPSQAPHSSLVYMFEVIRQKLGFLPSSFVANVDRENAWVLDCDAVMLGFREAMERGSPLVLCGTAFSFVHLLDFVTKRKLSLRLPPLSRVMETGGYKGRSRSLPKAELHGLIAQRLGISPERIVCEYGMSELSSQAYDINPSMASDLSRGNTRSFVFPQWARAQIVSPETGREVADGETGLLRICDLANVFSVMAIQTEDLAVRRGTGFELLGRAELAEPRGCSLMSPDVSDRES